MGSKNDARFHPGRTDSNRRARGSRRRASVYWTANEETAARARAGDVRTAAWQAERYQAFLDALNAETEAGDESLDGLHPVEAP